MQATTVARSPLSGGAIGKTEVMAVPKKKKTPSRRNMRRSHDALRPAAYVECPECGELKRPHHICPSCGHYKDREVVDVTAPV